MRRRRLCEWNAPIGCVLGAVLTLFGVRDLVAGGEQ